MIFKSEDKQFKLADDGQILWQQDPTNPLPGVPIGHITKGDNILKPKAILLESLPLSAEDRIVIAEKLQQWMDLHVHFTLEPLFRLTGGDDLVGQAKDIAEKLREALGILPRETLTEFITGLDEAGRKLLRDRKVRMGPLLVFLPELNKPAAVRLRGILLTLWQDKTLPASLPKDGVVSFTIADKDIDPDYYRSIGYPVYGPRSIRVDMLDRVICAIYDGAKDGVFKAEHRMAEWLGCNILDLYAVLAAMGHTIIHDPAAEKVKQEEVKPEEKPKENIVVPAETDVVSEEVSSAPVVTEAKVKPELATFRLKRNRSTHAPKHESKPRPEKTFEKKEKTFSKGDMKPFNKKDKDGERPFKKRDGAKPKREDRDDREDRVYSSKPIKMEDSPFAILQQLKMGNDKKN